MAFIRSNITYTVLGKTFCDPFLYVPMDGDVIFWKDEGGKKLVGVCVGRIFDCSEGNSLSILVKHDSVRPATEGV